MLQVSMKSCRGLFMSSFWDSSLVGEYRPDTSLKSLVLLLSMKVLTNLPESVVEILSITLSEGNSIEA